jgi:hypothetical protein
LFTGTISVRSRFTGPTPVARFSIAVVIARKVRALVCASRKKSARVAPPNARNEKPKLVGMTKPASDTVVRGRNPQWKSPSDGSADENRVQVFRLAREKNRLERCRETADVQL